MHDHSTAETELAALRDEVRALRAAAAAGDAFAGRVAAVLFGPAAAAGAAATRQETLLVLVGALRDFAQTLARVYLAATTEGERTMAGALPAALGAAAHGDAAAAATLLASLTQRIGSQLVAFREACDVGARELLRQLAPAAIEIEAAKGATVLLGRRLFLERECWETYQRRWTELRDAEQLYATYFDGAFKRALLRRAPGAETDREPS